MALKSLDPTLVIVDVNRDFRYGALDDCHVSLYIRYAAAQSLIHTLHMTSQARNCR